MGIRIYTVGIGKKEYYRADLFGNQRLVKGELDMTRRCRRFRTSRGENFTTPLRAGVLWENIRDIDRLERSEVDLKIYHEFHDKSGYILIIAAALFFLEIVLRSAVYRKVP